MCADQMVHLCFAIQRRAHALRDASHSNGYPRPSGPLGFRKSSSRTHARDCRLILVLLLGRCGRVKDSPGARASVTDYPGFEALMFGLTIASIEGGGKGVPSRSPVRFRRLPGLENPILSQAYGMKRAFRLVQREYYPRSCHSLHRCAT